MTDIEWEAQALLSLRPLASWTQRDGGLEWHDTEQTEPTQEEIDAKVVELISEWTANEYARGRQAEYPSIGDQMDMLYHDLLNSTTTWKDAIAKVKDDNPKI